MDDGDDDLTGGAPPVDSHAHVWDETCQIVPDGSHRPAYTAPVETYLHLLDAHRIERAVLVQPSFLGTDNSYLLAALAAYPDRLRGIAVLYPQTTEDALDDLADAGIIGLRLNMMHRTAPDLAAMQPLLAAINRRGWWTEVHASGAMWTRILPALPGNTRLMIDHFGRPDGPDCPGLAALLARPRTGTCVKLSAPYRVPAPDLATLTRRLIAHFGAENCLWGSDWPWTQHEDRHTYRDSIGWLDRWADPAERRRIVDASAGLAGFIGPG